MANRRIVFNVIPNNTAMGQNAGHAKTVALMQYKQELAMPELDQWIPLLVCVKTDISVMALNASLER
jgi:hypothetical protein